MWLTRRGRRPWEPRVRGLLGGIAALALIIGWPILALIVLVVVARALVQRRRTVIDHEWRSLDPRPLPPIDNGQWKHLARVFDAVSRGDDRRAGRSAVVLSGAFDPEMVQIQLVGLVGIASVEVSGHTLDEATVGLLLAQLETDWLSVSTDIEEFRAALWSVSVDTPVAERVEQQRFWPLVKAFVILARAADRPVDELRAEWNRMCAASG
jgi:hypothetical protein